MTDVHHCLPSDTILKQLPDILQFSRATKYLNHPDKFINYEFEQDLDARDKVLENLRREDTKQNTKTIANTKQAQQTSAPHTPPAPRYHLRPRTGK